MAAKITRKSKERKKKGTRYCPLVTIWWDMGRYGKIRGETGRYDAGRAAAYGFSEDGHSVVQRGVLEQ